jgi:hypothetical protein
MAGEKKRASRFYASNLIVQSVLDPERFYFCAKVELLPNNVMRVIGKKHDVTLSLQPWLLKKHRMKKGKTHG